jgi:hypothetical protein
MQTSSPATARPVAENANRYLYSAVGTLEPLRLYRVGRAQLVLFASLPLLVVGLALIYFPAARHPAVLFAVAVVVAAVAFLAPRSALLLAQAGLLGLLLAGLAAWLARLMPPAAPATIPVRGSSQGIRERSVTELYQRPPSLPAPPSTATDPLIPASGDVPS